LFLASQPKSGFNQWLKGRELARLTHFTLTEPKKFRAVVEQARRDDYCLASEEHELGVHALAVPLRNARGQLLAAINLVVASGHMPQADLLREFLGPLRDAARELRALL
jgi:IclR family pca regulon transcriptional regulator